MAVVSGFQPHSHLPYGETGSGYYSDHTIGIYDVINAATAQTLLAADKALFSQDASATPFVICDYGTADGGTSMFLLRQLLDLLKRKFGDNQCIQIIYEDQASNDFNSLFTKVCGPSSYIHDYSKVYVSVCGTSFFSQCFPPETVHLGFSSTAMHWLYNRPCCLRDCLHHTMSTIPEEKRSFAEQAASDWETILLQRAVELKTGGQMVIVCFCIDNKGQFLGSTDRVKESMFQQMTTIWKSMTDEGKITEDEFLKTTFNNYYRNEREFQTPLTDPNSPAYKAGLRLVSMETKVIPCCYHKSWMESGKNKSDKDAARAHAKWFVPTTRSWSNSTFHAALSENRSDQEKTDIVDELFQRYEDKVAETPEDHGMDYVHAYLHIEKIRTL